MVYDDEHLALWERGKGSTSDNLRDGTKVTVFLRKPPLRESGLLPKGGVARFYGIAQIFKSGAATRRSGDAWFSPRRTATPTRRDSPCSSRSSARKIWTESRSTSCDDAARPVEAPPRPPPLAPDPVAG